MPSGRPFTTAAFLRGCQTLSRARAHGTTFRIDPLGSGLSVYGGQTSEMPSCQPVGGNVLKDVVRKVLCHVLLCFSTSFHLIFKMQDRALQLFSVTLVCLILTWITVPLRCFVRARLSKSFGLDDWFMMASLVSTDTNSESEKWEVNDLPGHFHCSLWHALCRRPLWYGFA